jgi:hypothetical protein
MAPVIATMRMRVLLAGWGVCVGVACAGRGAD